MQLLIDQGGACIVVLFGIATDNFQTNPLSLLHFHLANLAFIPVKLACSLMLKNMEKEII